MLREVNSLIDSVGIEIEQLLSERNLVFTLGHFGSNARASKSLLVSRIKDSANHTKVSQYSLINTANDVSIYDYRKDVHWGFRNTLADDLVVAWENKVANYSVIKGSNITDTGSKICDMMTSVESWDIDLLESPAKKMA